MGGRRLISGKGRQNAISTTNTAFSGVFTARSIARVISDLSKTTFPSQKTATAISNSSMFNPSLVPVSSHFLEKVTRDSLDDGLVGHRHKRGEKNGLIQMCAL